MTDSHCHLASTKFPTEEIPELISRARENGIERFITVATCPEDIAKNLELAHGHSEIHACLGIHPCDVQNCPDDFESLLLPHLDDAKVAALGETGLDYFHPAPEGWSGADYHARQRDFLRRHFELAAAHGLNVVIHTRDHEGQASFDDALAIFREFHGRTRAVFHCFPGPPELAEKIFALGGLISFTGIVTFKKAEAITATAASCPTGSFMLETDSPYLAPVPKRGQRNEPAFTRHTAEKIAELRNTSLKELETETEKTVQRFFRLQK